MEYVDETAGSAQPKVKDGEYKFVIILDGAQSYTLVTQPTGINDNLIYTIDGMLLNLYKTQSSDRKRIERSGGRGRFGS